MSRKTRKIKQKGGAEIKVDLEHAYYSPFTPECLKGSSGEQIRDINKNFIYEYDDDTLKRVSFFDTGDRIGHVNKIFCAKFDLDNPNVIYSGGWDRNVCIWDIRAGGNHCGTIFGP